MFRKNINFVFYFIIMISLVLNPYLCRKAFAQETSNLIENNEKKPQPKTGEIVGELLLGSLGSFGAGCIGAVIGSSMANDEGMFAGLGEGILGYLIGSTLGSSLGVYIIGTSGDDTGSYGSALIGSIVGSGAGIAIIIISTNIISDDDNITPEFIGFTLAQSIGATIAFNKSRTKQVISQNEALIQYKKGNLSISYPKIHFKSHPLQPGRLIKTVNLVSVEF